MKLSITAAVVVLLVATVPAQAQIVPIGEDEQQEQLRLQQQVPLRPAPPGRVAGSTIGEVGQREQSVQGIRPMARVANRVQNRIQNRLRNRIDRNYDPQANAADPFAVAEDQVRNAGSPRR